MKMNREPIYITDPIKGLVLAGHIENGKFIKEANKNDHFFRVHGGYAIQSEVFDILNSKNIHDITVRTRKKLYHSKAISWRTIPACGHGQQKALALDNMKEENING